MKILLVDADSTIPNISLMKLSTYHKKKGDEIYFTRYKLPYYPRKIKRSVYIPEKDYDKIYVSVVFEGNLDSIQYKDGQNIIFGGTGVDLKTVLPDEIENSDSDYSLYPGNRFSYGFITRGCIRNCSFCKVREKEGYIHKVNDPENIVKHKRVIFFDNNILAYEYHKDILSRLNAMEVRYEFNQGLDIRLIDKENSLLLRDAKYGVNKFYTFAFDDWRYKDILKEKLKILDLWRRKWKLRFFIYVHPGMEVEQTVKRINWLRDNYCLPYIMRDISCYTDKNKNFYTDLAGWCNQPHFFRKVKFLDFIRLRTKKEDRIRRSADMYYSHGGKD